MAVDIAGQGMRISSYCCAKSPEAAKHILQLSHPKTAEECAAEFFPHSLPFYY